MKKLFLLGALAIVVLAAGSAYLIWRAGEAGPPLASAAAPAPAAEPAPAAPSEAPAQLAPPPTLEPERPVVESATDRDPRNDIQRPTDRRADLLQEERLAKQESAMDQLNRRAARRKEAMQALGEIRPSAPAAPQQPRQ